MATYKHYLWQLFGMISLIVSLLMLAAASVPAFAQDYSRSYQYGGRVHVPAPESSGDQPIIDIEGDVDVEAGGVLGCSGLNLDSMVSNTIGGVGGEDLSKGLADAAKTALFREMLTRTMANPQVASVLENIQGTLNARISMQQKRCNAREIFADATNKRLQDEAMQRCVEEEQNMEICQRHEKRIEYVEQTIESDKWQKGLHKKLCEEGGEDRGGCGWLSLVPNAKTSIDGSDPEAAHAKPLMGSLDLQNMATGYAVDMINERVRAAKEFIGQLGYAKAMQAALYNQPGLPPDIQPNLPTPLSDAAVPDAPEAPDLPQLYTLYDHNNSTACQFTVERGMQTRMSRVMQASGGDDVVFPIAGANINNTEITSLFGPRTRPCQGCSTFHSGMDFAPPSGTGVVSSIGGVVRQAGFNSCGGNTVVIGGDGTLVKYLHLDQINPQITPGTPVNAGTPLGQVGNTGSCTTGAHLHFTINHNGAVIDPLPWLGGDDSVLQDALGGEDKHGLTSMAVSRLADDSDDEFIANNHKQAAQLGARLANTVRCKISKTMHPQTFVKIALLTGSTGPFSRGDLVSEGASSQEIQNALASGDKGAIIHGLSKVVGQYAAVSTYSATINEMAVRIATASTGEEGMNKPLYNRSRAELGRLKFERFQMVQNYNTSCKSAQRLSKAMAAREARIERAQGVDVGLPGLAQNPLECAMFENIKDDGLEDIIEFATKTDEDVEKMRQRQQQ